MEDGRTRRGFLALVLGGAAGLVAAAASVPTLLAGFSPLRRRAQPGTGWIPVARLDELVRNLPQRVQVITRIVDAWAKSDPQPAGTAFVIKRAPEQVDCFSARCPHAGCDVDFDGQLFVCPCHNSKFGLDGARLSGPAKRGLDPLPTRVVGNEVQLELRTFRTGTKDREEI